MAQKIITIYTDDLTGEESSEAATHVLALDGKTYEIDLAPASYEKLMKALAPFTEAGRKTSSRTGKPRKVAATSSGSGDTAAIRAWAKKNGYEVNDRGRVPASVKEAYEARK
ncbi:Lsr2 family protein [Streptomyces sp. NPDC057654]|uniref:histone-like nucleoid-structuring protein Lsr2 n=1 Tax=Streptomyces sp. NPDC057654 TaxID=3346196 RepID=UPI0036C855F2